MQLFAATPVEWAVEAAANFDAFLCDHAACERKASATALSFAAHYPDKTELVSQMIAMAREELAHFSQVWELMKKRGLQLQPDEKDAYVGALRQLARSAPEVYLLDRLLIAGIIEARGAERFSLLAAALPEGDERAFYARLADAEARHRELFVNLAERYFAPEVVVARCQELLVLEAGVIARLPFRAALH